MIDLIIIIMAGIVLLFLLSCCFMVARLLDLEALYLQCLMHRRNAMQEIPELKGLSETCNRIYKLQDVDVLFQCLLMDQMDWEEEKLYVQFSTIYLLKQTVKN